MIARYHRILVAIDGSDEAECAFEKSMGIAKRNNAVLNLVYVVDTSSYIAIAQRLPDSVYDFIEYGRRMLNGYRKNSIAAGVSEVNIIVVPGSPKKIISNDIAKIVKADLIVCGAQGLHAVEHFLMGSVSQHIVRTSPCDVLVVKTPSIRPKGQRSKEKLVNIERITDTSLELS